ncbi:hypothetical protein AAGG74_10520 [Bacillus mexicanus]|uniref:hypothetical protein n=1 Tax=Bacillus mexicanus TaxID=2834415 RepID=UPI003D250720
MLQEKYPMDRTLYLVLIAFIGLNFANNVLNDIYRLGTIGWCHTTQNRVEKVVCENM